MVRGPRITVQTVLESLAAGDSVEDVLEEYPKLARADVQACLRYASRLMDNHFSVVPAVHAGGSGAGIRVAEVKHERHSGQGPLGEGHFAGAPGQRLDDRMGDQPGGYAHSDVEGEAGEHQRQKRRD